MDTDYRVGTDFPSGQARDNSYAKISAVYRYDTSMRDGNLSFYTHGGWT